MPRSKSSAPPHVGQAVQALVDAITGLVGIAGQAVQRGREVGKAAKGVKAAVKGRGPGKGNTKLRAALKKSWANYTPKQRAERVRKMLAGRGLKPKHK